LRSRSVVGGRIEASRAGSAWNRSGVAFAKKRGTGSLRAYACKQRALVAEYENAARCCVQSLAQVRAHAGSARQAHEESKYKKYARENG